MKNKRVKQMIHDVTMQGRKLFWYGETSEVFIAKSAEAVKSEYDDSNYSDPEDMICEEIKTSWRTTWRPCLSEECVGGAKKRDDGYYQVPMISFISSYDESCPAPQLFSSYN